MLTEKIESILNVDEEAKNKPKSNVEIFIDWLFDKYDYRFNEITQRPEYSPKDKDLWQPVDDVFVNSLEIEARIAGFSKNIVSLINTILKSKHIPHQNDLEIFFKRLPEPKDVYVNDGYFHTPTIKKYFEMLEIRESETFDREILYKLFQKWLVSAVNNVLKKRQNDVMLVLMGDQGKKKTSYLEHLVPKELKEKYYYVGHIEPSLTNNNTANYLCEKFIINIDDQLDSIFNKDFNALKSIISTTQVTNRRVYSVYDKTRKRIANFVGSVNNTSFLIDSENRRYFVLNIAEINPDYWNIDPKQIWAEAYYCAKHTDPFKIFTKDDYILINEIANQYTMQSYEALLLKRYFRPTPNDVYNIEIFMTASEISFEFSKDYREKFSTKKIALELKRNKFEQKNIRLKRYDHEPRLVYILYTKSEYINNFRMYIENEPFVF